MEHLTDMAMAKRLAERVAEKGGRAYYVGGFVRDALMGQTGKDLDIEVHGIAPAALEEILDSLGTRLAVGESFGIFGLKGYHLDIAMPRKEKLRGRGHRDFDVFVDPFIGVEAAARRRDFTVNAMMMDVLTGEVLDPFGGRQDLEKGILRHVCDETFPEDALRVLRGAQFAARFRFDVAPETRKLCAAVTLADLPRERVLAELEKALLKAEEPSLFFRTLRQMEQLEHWFPEVKALIGVPQNARYHAEGDVWTHTMLVLDQAAALKHRTQDPLGFMLGALIHDFGKALCTREINGVLHSYDHEILGLPVADRFLRRLTSERRRIAYALDLAKHHMRPNTSARSGASVKSTNHLFDDAMDPEALICIAMADDLGKLPQGNVRESEAFLEARLEIYRSVMAQPHVTGADLIALGFQPGTGFSELLAYAHKLRLAGIDKESALKQTAAYGRTLGKTRK